MSSAFKRAEKIKKTAEASLFDEEKPAAIEDSSSSDSDGHQSDSDASVEVEDAKNKLTKKVKKVLLGEDSKLTKDAEKTEGAGEDDETALRAFKDQDASEKEWKNRQRTLVFCARGVKSKFRDLMDNITDMLPHCKKESKIERKVAKEYVNDLCF